MTEALGDPKNTHQVALLDDCDKCVQGLLTNDASKQLAIQVVCKGTQKMNENKAQWSHDASPCICHMDEELRALLSLSPPSKCRLPSVEAQLAKMIARLAHEMCTCTAVR